MKFLTNENIKNFKNYKYESEDKCYLTKYYSKLWNYLSIKIPRKIHPNIITLCGLGFIFIAYGLSKYSHIIMGLGFIGYIICDGIDGIHASNTKQTSIIGEYLDHLVDLISTGIVQTYILKMLGLENIIINNILTMFVSLQFILTHYKTIQTKKIIFSGLSDISLISTLVCILIFANKKFPLAILNNQLAVMGTFTLCLLIFMLDNIYKIMSNSFLTREEKYFRNIFLGYWILRFIMCFSGRTTLYWSWIIIDLLILTETINLKIFKSHLLNVYILFGLIFTHIYSPFISNLIALGYLEYFIYSISKELNINLLQNPPSVYLPRVYCCGVFDMCHLGHMKLFEKIHKSFDHLIWLIVGVHSDMTVRSYKREPIINETFRIETVNLCKYVDEVFPNADLIVTKEFCIENKIDCVIIGEEYKYNKDKIWYRGGMELNIHKYISRYEPISTTLIIDKIIKQLNK